MILDDTVMDNSNVVFAVEMRMGISCGNFTVGCPADMTDSSRSGEPVHMMLLVHFIKIAYVFYNTDTTVDDSGQTGGVITPIFQPSKSI